MIVAHFGGKKVCNNLEELKQVLKVRTKKNVNEFNIFGETEFPYMVILVNGDYAYLHYFDKDDDPGYRSWGGGTDLDENGTSIFYTNTDNEEVIIENCSIMPFAKASLVVQEFFESRDMPKSIEWDEL